MLIFKTEKINAKICNGLQTDFYNEKPGQLVTSENNRPILLRLF